MPTDPHAFIAEHKGKDIDGKLFHLSLTRHNGLVLTIDDM